MDTSKIYEKALKLRNFHKAAYEASQELLDELEKEREPRKPRRNQGKKQQLLAEANNYIIASTKNTRPKKNHLKQALQRHNLL